MRVLIDESYSRLMPRAMQEVEDLAFKSEKDEVRLKATLEIVDHFKESSRGPAVMVPIQIVNNLGMPEVPIVANAPRILEVGGKAVDITSPSNRKKKVVMAREENWRAQTEKAVDSMVLDSNPAAVGSSPEPKTVVIQPRKTPKLEITQAPKPTRITKINR